MLRTRREGMSGHAEGFLVAELLGMTGTGEATDEELWS